MLTGLHIEGFRCFDRFDMEGLGRVNLLTGVNNCGKTTVLEAIHALTDRGAMRWAEDACRRRGDSANVDDDVEAIDFGSFFHRRKTDAGSQFEVTAPVAPRMAGLGAHELRFVARLAEGRIPAFGEGRFGVMVGGLNLQWFPDVVNLEASTYLGRWVVPSDHYLRHESSEKVVFVGSNSLSQAEAAAHYGRVVLTAAENDVTSAIQEIASEVERTALMPGASRPPGMSATTTTIAAKVDWSELPIPLAALGEGTWRLFSLAVAMGSIRGGTLLVDEIDSGIHFTSLTKLWTFIHETAKRLDIQVFATTHSQDCIRSLAEVARETEDPEAFTIQRIEREKGRAVAFDQRGIVVAAERDIEVR